MQGEDCKFFVGTSGWTYDHWIGNFYPDKLPKHRWFSHYLTVFNAVEVNATFYRSFQDATFHNWFEKAPENFRYVLKAPRIITHRKYLEDVSGEIQEFWRSACLLGSKLGLILLQVAPATPYDLRRLEAAIRAFGDPRKVAVEVRSAHWLTKDTQQMLADLGAVFCNADSPRLRLTDWVTSTSAYIRLHGRRTWYADNYSDDELEEIAQLARNMGERGAKEIYVFFNNDFEGYAPQNAQTLSKMLSRISLGL
jgi:uncharacterized protein YecE (DUF72 family)